MANRSKLGPQRHFSVEIETEPLSNFTLPVDVAVDRLSRGLAGRGERGSVCVAGTPDRSISVQASVAAASAFDAMRTIVDAMEKACRKHDLGVVMVRSLTAGPETVHEYQEPEVVSQPQVAARSVPASPVDTARLLSGVHRLSRELTTQGHAEVARTFEPYLRPGMPNFEVLNGLRHHLIEVRSTELCILYDMEQRLDDLIGLANAAMGQLNTRATS